jgi:GDP-fucose transporter C1
MREMASKISSSVASTSSPTTTSSRMPPVAAGGKPVRSSLDVAVVVAFYWVVSILLVFLNKVAMSGSLDLDAPLFLTWTQIVLAVVGCIIIGFIKPYFPQTLAFFPSFEYKSDLAMKCAPLTFVFVGMIVFNNLCLKYVEVSFYQIARSLTIVFNVILSYVVLKESTSRASLITVGIVVFGYILGCDGEVNFSWIGVMFGVTASVFVAMNSIMVKRTMALFKGDSFLLLIYSNVNAMIAMPFIFLFAGEVPAIYNSGAFKSGFFWNVVIFTGVFGFLINIATFMQIEYTSALSHNVSGTAKSGLQTILAYGIWGTEVTVNGILGNIFVLGGSLLYAYVRHVEGKKKQPQPYQKVPTAEMSSSVTGAAVDVEKGMGAGVKDSRSNQ